MEKENFEKEFNSLLGFKKNPFHPLVWILGDPIIGKNVYIGGMSEINATGAKVMIGDNCDIASFVTLFANGANALSTFIATLSVILYT